MEVKMKRMSLGGVLLICVLMTASTLWAADLAQTSKIDDYIIGPGDVLEISVWNNEALTKSMTVLPDGKIHFPLIGEVVVGGKTLAVLEKELEQKIGTFVPDPSLSVMVQQVNSMLIYVIGKVNHPGRFVLNANVNVLQVLAMAGGLNAFAKRNKIKIFRETKGKTDTFQFEYDDVTEGKNLAQNIGLERGDVVVVP
jgi:polysaccharide export outer membrane protein